MNCPGCNGRGVVVSLNTVLACGRCHGTGKADDGVARAGHDLVANGLYDQMRNLMRGAGVHLPPWSKLSSSERLGWARIAERASQRCDCFVAGAKGWPHASDCPTGLASEAEGGEDPAP